MQQLQQFHIINAYIIYMFALLLSFYLGFYIIMKYYQGSLKDKIRYSITAGLLSVKFVIAVASVLGIDHLLFYLIIGKLWIPITSNGLLFTSSLLATLSLNWEKLQKHFTISEKEYESLLEY